MARFTKSILVELQITTTANGSSINFSDVPQLRGKFVQGIETYTANEVTKTQTQRDVIAQANVSSFLVNLVTDSETVFENIPYFTFNTYYNGGIIREFKNLKININKSNIYITSGSGLSTSQSALFTFYYTDLAV
jgi:hypothetical protein